jgi:hypothetical protein
VVAVGDEPYGSCWSVAYYLLIKAQTPLPIDTDPCSLMVARLILYPQLPSTGWEMVPLVSPAVTVGMTKKVQGPVFIPKLSPWPMMGRSNTAMWLL